MKSVLIIGGGAISQRHCDALEHLGVQCKLVGSREFDAQSDPDSFMAGQRCDGVLLCGPATHRLHQFQRALSFGCPVFVEKPITASASSAHRLAALAAKSGMQTTVGYCLRFDELVQLSKGLLAEGAIGEVWSVRAAVGQRLDLWRPSVTDPHDTVSANALLGGGALLELSHEIDLIQWLTGNVESITAFLSRSSDLVIDVEDTADMLCELPGSITASIHLDMTDSIPNRTIRWVGSKGTLAVDLVGGSVQCGVESWTRKRPVSDMYQAQMEAFVHHRSSDGATVDDAIRVLAVIDAARESATKKIWCAVG